MEVCRQRVFENRVLRRLFGSKRDDVTGVEENIQGVSQLVDINAGGDFPGLCDQKSSCKHVSDFGRLQSYDRLKLRIEGNDY